jgi:hypothetical protein
MTILKRFTGRRGHEPYEDSLCGRNPWHEDALTLSEGCKGGRPAVRERLAAILLADILLLIMKPTRRNSIRGTIGLAVAWLVLGSSPWMGMRWFCELLMYAEKTET